MQAGLHSLVSVSKQQLRYCGSLFKLKLSYRCYGACKVVLRLQCWAISLQCTERTPLILFQIADDTTESLTILVTSRCCRPKPRICNAFSLELQYAFVQLVLLFRPFRTCHAIFTNTKKLGKLCHAHPGDVTCTHLPSTEDTYLQIKTSRVRQWSTQQTT